VGFAAVEQAFDTSASLPFKLTDKVDQIVVGRMVRGARPRTGSRFGLGKPKGRQSEP
jgi:hypothetical protein